MRGSHLSSAGTECEVGVEAILERPVVSTVPNSSKKSTPVMSDGRSPLKRRTLATNFNLLFHESKPASYATHPQIPQKCDYGQRKAHMCYVLRRRR
ncbi:hypothetical protein QE152_g10777 [Popillia japonica]|uniref:Uncharacterized protein n=1 Tax=Popillia japonica TaxID=7064 RepID=A0AAW1LTQ0_POPJA